MTDATAPGQQGVLFVPDVDRLAFAVVLGDGRRLAAGSLGVALSMARRVVVEAGEAWIVASDGSTARLTTTAVESAFARPWVHTLTDACKEQS